MTAIAIWMFGSPIVALIALALLSKDTSIEERSKRHAYRMTTRQDHPDDRRTDAKLVVGGIVGIVVWIVGIAVINAIVN